MNALVRRLHNPQGRACGCDADCWCRRNPVGRAVKWWFPARLFGLEHKHTARDERQATRSDGSAGAWERLDGELRGGSETQ